MNIFLPFKLSHHFIRDRNMQGFILFIQNSFFLHVLTCSHSLIQFSFHQIKTTANDFLDNIFNSRIHFNLKEHINSSEFWVILENLTYHLRGIKNQIKLIFVLFSLIYPICTYRHVLCFSIVYILLKIKLPAFFFIF